MLALCSPLLQRIGFVEEYAALLQLYVLMANLHALCGAMAQALGRVRLYAATGVLCTALVVGLNLLLLSVLRMGVAGYILSNVIADAVSAAVLFFALRLWRSIRPRALPRSLLRGMLRYCLPRSPRRSAPGSSTSPTATSSLMCWGATYPACMRWPTRSPPSC